MPASAPTEASRDSRSRPDGLFVYAMLQSAMLDEGAGNGACAHREVQRAHRKALAQYAYRMEGSSQGRGISALVALDDHELLVLERNNRGLGVDAELTPPNKKVFRIDLTGATDVTAVDLDALGAVFTPVAKDDGAVARPRGTREPRPRLARGAERRVAREVGGPYGRAAARRRLVPRARRHRQRLLRDAERERRAVRSLFPSVGRVRRAHPVRHRHVLKLQERRRQRRRRRSGAGGLRLQRLSI